MFTHGHEHLMRAMIDDRMARVRLDAESARLARQAARNRRAARRSGSGRRS